MGRGPAPKDPRDRARRNKDPMPTRMIPHEPAPQPELPEKMPNGDDWPEMTREWWAMWDRTPQAREFGATDWSDLLDCAVLHALFWLGDMKYAGELRLRVAKHGMTPGDRARLRMTFATAKTWDAATQRWV